VTTCCGEIELSLAASEKLEAMGAGEGGWKRLNWNKIIAVKTKTCVRAFD
jgi:hypothetical protein